MIGKDVGIQELYSVEQVAELLGLHVRTVRAYVREGKLQAVRIGKQYRIARADLEAFTGRPVRQTPAQAATRTRQVEVSGVVQIDAISPNEAMRITNTLVAVANSRGAGDTPLRVEAMYEEERARLRIILLGDLPATAELLKIIATLTEVAS